LNHDVIAKTRVFQQTAKANNASQFVAGLLGLLSVTLGHASSLGDQVGKDAEIGG
jgi:hypothetical protein